MTTSSQFINPDIAQYLLDHSLRETEILTRLRQQTAALPQARMQIAPEQGQLIQLLCKVSGARRCIEVGTFTGYSALCIATAIPDDGLLIACDISEEFTNMAKPYWQTAGVEKKIDLRIAPALETLEQLSQSEPADSFDLAFIDADKENYINYYEAILPLLRPGGLLILDNVLWGGRVIEASATDPDTLAIREINKRLLSDTRVDISMLPIADGVTLVVKK